MEALPNNIVVGIQIFFILLIIVFLMRIYTDAVYAIGEKVFNYLKNQLKKLRKNRAE